MIAERFRAYLTELAACIDTRRKVIETWVFAGKRATYGLAVLRITYGVLVMILLAVNFEDRYVMWGPGARWLQPLVDGDALPLGIPALFSSRSPTLFTATYVSMGVIAFVFALGWHTRLVTPILLWFWIALLHQNPVVTDAGDDLVRITLVYACFADLSARWSLDARRRASAAARPVRPRGPVLPAWPGNLLHNAAVVAMACQIFVVYVANGMNKTQGGLWQDGSAVYYALHEPSHVVSPALSNLIASSPLQVLVATYMTVFLELFFPLLLLTRGTRILALVGVTVMHLGIGVLMAIPLFSMAILAVDAIFVGDRAFARLEVEVKWFASVVRGQRRSRDVATAGGPELAGISHGASRGPSGVQSHE